MAKKSKTLSVASLPITVQSMLERAVNTLKLIHAKSGVDFAVYSKQYGISEGTMDLTKLCKPNRTRQSKLPYGTLVTYYLPFIKNLEPDGLVQIPAGDFNPVSLQGAISAHASKMWGKGSVTCVLSQDKATVEIWRLPAGLGKQDVLAPSGNFNRQTD